MAEPQTFTFADDGAIPNSKLPLLVYRQAVPADPAAIERHVHRQPLASRVARLGASLPSLPQRRARGAWASPAAPARCCSAALGPGAGGERRRRGGDPGRRWPLPQEQDRRPADRRRLSGQHRTARPAARRSGRARRSCAQRCQGELPAADPVSGDNGPSGANLGRVAVPRTSASAALTAAWRPSRAIS